MKRLIVAALLVAGCTPASTGNILPAAGPSAAASTAPAPGASAAPSAPGATATPAAPTTQPTTTPAALNWPRLADLPVTLPLTKARLWARSAKDVYAAVGTGDLWRYDGTKWQAIPVPFAGNVISVTGNAEAVWAGTDKGAIAKVNKDNSLSVAPGISTHPIPSLAVVDGATETLLAACTDGNNAAMIIQGTTATPQLPVRKVGTAVAAAKGKQFVFTRDGFAAYRDSGTSGWVNKEEAASDPIRGIAAYPGGKSDLDVMAVGDKGTSVRLTGGFFQPFGTATDRPQLNDVAAADGSGVFAVGDNGLILYFGSESWRQAFSVPSLGNILAATALGPREIIILTSKGQLFAGPYIQYF